MKREVEFVGAVGPELGVDTGSIAGGNCAIDARVIGLRQCRRHRKREGQAVGANAESRRRIHAVDAEALSAYAGADALVDLFQSRAQHRAAYHATAVQAAVNAAISAPHDRLSAAE